MFSAPITFYRCAPRVVGKIWGKTGNRVGLFLSGQVGAGCRCNPITRLQLFPIEMEHFLMEFHFFLQAGEHAASRTNTEDLRLRKGCSDIAAVQYKIYAPAAWAALSPIWFNYL